jgi:signal transduction histidine kinase
VSRCEASAARVSVKRTTEKRAAFGCPATASIQELRALVQRSQNLLESERTRLARELHDGLVQKLTVLALEFSLMEARILAEENVARLKVPEKLKELAALVGDMIHALRKIQGTLRPKVLDEYGLIAALEWATDTFRKRTGLECRFTVHKEEPVVPPLVATGLFRMFQEILLNIERHAHAQRVEIEVQEKRKWLVLTVSDDGRGITAEQINSSSSLGLIELRERVLPWQGRLTVESAPGTGTRITVKVPVVIAQLGRVLQPAIQV